MHVNNPQQTALTNSAPGIFNMAQRGVGPRRRTVRREEAEDDDQEQGTATLRLATYAPVFPCMRKLSCPLPSHAAMEPPATAPRAGTTFAQLSTDGGVGARLCCWTLFETLMQTSCACR